MCNWDSAHLGDVFQYIKDPTPQDDNDAHFAWRKRWVEAYKEAQWWIKIGSRYYREVVQLQEQVKKMKCCGNCKHMDFSEPNYCMKGVFRERQYNCMALCNKWELAEYRRLINEL